MATWTLAIPGSFGLMQNAMWILPLVCFRLELLVLTGLLPWLLSIRQGAHHEILVPDVPVIVWSALFLLILFGLNYLSTRSFGEVNMCSLASR